MAAVSTTTRHVISLVRSSYPLTSSAGRAMYGTWNRLNAVAVSRNATKTQSPETTGSSPAGTAKVAMKNTGISAPPSTMNRRLDLVTARLRSLRAPITGSMMTSQILATVTRMPAARAATPRVSVR
jgi:hypothetical protein